MHRNKIGILVFVLLIVVSAIFGWKEYHRKNEPIKNNKPDFEISAAEIIKEFETNDSLPAKKYTRKLIAVRGRLKQIDKDDQGFLTMVLGNNNTMSSVRCAMDSLYASEAHILQKGDSATIKGMLTGFQKDETGLLGSDIILNRCLIETDKKQ